MDDGMEGVQSLYRIGTGPSSSHTLGPARAAGLFFKEFPDAHYYSVDLYGSLGLTGKGHGTDRAIQNVFKDRPVSFSWKGDVELEEHPNGLIFFAWNEDDTLKGERKVFSIGGGKLIYPGFSEKVHRYSSTTLKEILEYCTREGLPLWQFIFQEEPQVEEHLKKVWQAMKDSIERGFHAEGVLPGGLKLARKAAQYQARLQQSSGVTDQLGGLFAAALAVSEENAAGGKVVTAPTCGSSGVLPSVLYWFRNSQGIQEQRIYRALATAGLIGILVRHNASISGAEVGCQGEVGTACAMAAAAAAHLLGGSPHQIEYAAEMGLEHHLGLTCDPVMGLVQIPCIERNAMAAARAVEIAVFALLSDGRHAVSFDQVVETMYRTGKDLTRDYRETALGGLARFYRHPV